MAKIKSRIFKIFLLQPAVAKHKLIILPSIQSPPSYDNAIWAIKKELTAQSGLPNCTAALFHILHHHIFSTKSSSVSAFAASFNHPVSTDKSFSESMRVEIFSFTDDAHASSHVPLSAYSHVG